jgi:multidrug resistance efflux pump
MNNMTVGSIRTTVTPPLASGIYEALLEKAERERDEAREKAERYRLKTLSQDAELAEVREQLRLANIDFFNTQAEVEEQARLLGMGGEREALLITERDEARRDQSSIQCAFEDSQDKIEKLEQERDHYKQAIEHISTTIDDWLNSLIQEPPDDFIHAIKAWADKKLKEI